MPNEATPRWSVDQNDGRVRGEELEGAEGKRSWEDATVDEVKSILEQKGITEGTVCYCKGELGLVRIGAIKGAGETGTQVRVDVIKQSNTPNEWSQNWPIRDLLQSDPRPATSAEIAAAENGTLQKPEESEARNQGIAADQELAAQNRARAAYEDLHGSFEADGYGDGGGGPV